MNTASIHSKQGRIEELSAARCIANYAVESGVFTKILAPRPTCDHIGAVLADSVLQAGLNYVHVVRPRVQFILNSFPIATSTQALVSTLEEIGTKRYLQWKHEVKIFRFDNLVTLLVDKSITDTFELGKALSDQSFQDDLKAIKGVGPKTIDYMACLVGVDRIAVDRHIRGFATRAGLGYDDYDYIKKVFSYAADILEISRREFDAWVWDFQSQETNLQLKLEI